MSWTLCSSYACIYKAGANANSTVVASGAILSSWSDEIEGYINSITRYNWTGNYATLGANFKNILNSLASDLIAMRIINYDMSDYTSRYEATTMLNVLSKTADKALELLREQKVQEKIT